MAEFKTRIKEIREGLKMTQKEFAEFVGKGVSTIAMYELGEREPHGSSEFISLADKLGCTVDYLLGRSAGAGADDLSAGSENNFMKIINEQIKSYENIVRSNKLLICKEIENWNSESQTTINFLAGAISSCKLKIKALKQLVDGKQ